MSMLRQDDRELLVNRFRDELLAPVMLTAFTRKPYVLDSPNLECEFCRETEELVSEVAELSDKIVLNIREYSPDDGAASSLGVDKLPAVVIAGDESRGVTFYGIPGGFEFNTFVDGIIDVSRNATMLPAPVKEIVRGVNRDLHVQVFYTLTCPYCPSAVRTAHQMAVENPKHIRADAVEAAEFPLLVSKYDVIAVPTVVVNDRIEFEGALPEAEFVNHVLQATA